MAFVPSAHIIQRVVEVEESNGVVKTVTGRFLVKGKGDVLDINLPLDTYLSVRGADTALEVFRSNRDKGILGYYVSEDELSEEEVKKRRSERIKSKRDNAKESDPPSSNENKKQKDNKKKRNSAKRNEKSGEEDKEENGTGTPPLSDTDTPNDLDNFDSSSEEEDKEDVTDGKNDLTIKDVMLFEEEITIDTDGGLLYTLAKEYKKVCELDYAWVDRQLRRFRIEPPKPIAMELIERIELEGMLTPPDEVDMDRGANMKVEMVMHNMKDLTTKGIEGITKCKVLEIDFSGGVSFACIKFRIKGIFNGIRAIINVARSGQAVDLYFKQALDSYDKLRSVYINNAPTDIKNQTLWRETLKRELGKYGTVVDVMILRKIVTVTFARAREAFYFERQQLPISVAGCDVIATRTPLTIIRTPADVIVDGFYNDDAEETLEALAAEVGPINRATIVCRKDRGALVISFPNFHKAEEFVKRRKMSLERGSSNISNEVSIEWGRDSNTRKPKQKDETDSSSAVEAASVLAKISSLESKLKEEKKAGLVELRRMEKQRLKQEEARDAQRNNDNMWYCQMITESQNKVLNVVGATLANIADKQAVVDCLSDELSDYRGEKQLVNFQLMIMGADPGSAKAPLVETLNARRIVLEKKIEELVEKRSTAVNRKIELPALPPPTLIPLSLPAPKLSNGNAAKRKVEVIQTTPHRDTVDHLTEILKEKEGRREEASDVAWCTIFEDVTRKNLIKMGEVWTFMLPIGLAEKELIIAKYQAFTTVFQGTTEAATADTIIEHLSRAVTKEMEAQDRKNGGRKKTTA